MNTTEIDRIAKAVNVLRPDWPAASLRTLIASKLADRPRRDVLVALAWVASESESLTPARVLESGPWWKAASVETTVVVRHPPRRDQACPKHPGEWPESCRGCAGDKLAGDDSAFNPRRTEAGDRVAALKALRVQAIAGFCSHGVRPELCIDHRVKPERPHAPEPTPDAEPEPEATA